MMVLVLVGGLSYTVGRAVLRVQAAEPDARGVRVPRALPRLHGARVPLPLDGDPAASCCTRSRRLELAQASRAVAPCRAASASSRCADLGPVVDAAHAAHHVDDQQDHDDHDQRRSSMKPHTPGVTRSGRPSTASGRCSDGCQSTRAPLDPAGVSTDRIALIFRVIARAGPHPRTDRPPRLDARYGRTPGRRVRARWLAAIVAAASRSSWSSPGCSGSACSARRRRSRPATSATTLIDASTRSTCASEVTRGSRHPRDLRASRPSTRTSPSWGGRSCTLPAVRDQRTRQFTETLRTSEPGRTGLIYRCWLT